MIRYVLAATALKAFSFSPATKRVYRRIGNTFGALARANTNLDTYIKRGNLLVELYRKHEPLKPGARVLELGTGWMHWYGIYLRLFNDIRVTTLDVWDNRQFDALMACFGRLRDRLDPVPPALNKVLSAKNLDDLYALINLDHHIVADGSLAKFGDSVFDSICSMHVLEHVPRAAVPTLLQHMYRTLKPGAIAVHQIGLADHISSQYDRKVSPKQYISYSRRVWKRWFENDLQYINLLQASDWTSEFERAGFICLEQLKQRIDISRLKISSEFSAYSAEDLACTNSTVVLRKPPASC